MGHLLISFVLLMLMLGPSFRITDVLTHILAQLLENPVIPSPNKRIDRDFIQEPPLLFVAQCFRGKYGQATSDVSPAMSGANAGGRA